MYAAVQSIEQTPPGVETVGAHVGAESQLRHGEVGSVRISQDEERIARAAEQPPKKPGCGGPPAPSFVMYGIET